MKEKQFREGNFMKRRLFIVFFVFFFAITASGQIQRQNLAPVAEKDNEEKNLTKLFCRNNHSSEWEFTADIGFLPPVSILEVKETRVNWAYAGKDEIRLGSLEIEDGVSVLPVDFNKKRSGCYSITFCKEHLVILTLEALDKNKCRKLE